MHIDHKGPSITEAELQSFEMTIRAMLSDDYRLFLLSENGGVPCTDRGGQLLAVYFLGKPHTSADVRYMFGLRDQYSYSLTKHLAMFRDRVPQGCLPIASTSGGDLFLICLSGDRRGTVLFWDHENEAPEGQPPSVDNVVPVAESFTAFLHRLEIPRRRVGA